ncbi:MAG: hypothetical protein IPI46_05095 [Bacteroidetes bacterium]|nr:hypothetical protein [Bacteroidota bacterium]
MVFIFRSFFVFCIGLLPLFINTQKKKTVPKPSTKSIPVIEVVSLVSFEILENGDTINRLDSKNNRHGKWMAEYPAHHEEPAYIEIGNYVQGAKQGLWQSYYTNGILISEVNYKNNLKDGEARYYDESGLLCIGHYLALNAKYEFDTVYVEQVDKDELKPMVVKTDVGSIRHGSWTYYEPPSREIKRVIEFQGDDVVFDTTYTQMTKTDSLFYLQKIKSFPHVNKRVDTNEWIDTKNRKKIKYTDFPDNATHIKPNERKK